MRCSESQAQKIDQIKIWVDDRDAQRGSQQRMSPEVLTAMVEEAHKRGSCPRARDDAGQSESGGEGGIDILVHTVRASTSDE